MRVKRLIAEVSVVAAAAGLGFAAGEAVLHDTEAAAKISVGFGVIGGVAVNQVLRERDRQRWHVDFMQRQDEQLNEYDALREAELIIQDAQFNITVERLEDSIKRGRETLDGNA